MPASKRQSSTKKSRVAPSAPRFRELSADECEALLARSAVGRIAYALHNHVDIEPIHYVFDDQWIYVRTSRGSKVDRLRRQPWVAFEVDEIHDAFNWQSVVVHGGVQALDDSGTAAQREAFTRAVKLLARLNPRILSDDDPVAFRTVFLRIHLDTVEGRAASSGPA